MDVYECIHASIHTHPYISGLRNYPAAAAPAEGVSPKLSGSFGPPNVFIESFVASGCAPLMCWLASARKCGVCVFARPCTDRGVATDPDNEDIVYSAQDVIAISFNRDTNLGWGPSGNLPLDTAVHKADIDALFEWSHNLGANYTGRWTSRSRFVITIADPTGATVVARSNGAVNALSVAVRESANLRNYPPSAAPTTSSAVLTGNWGMELPKPVSLRASDPFGSDSVYGVNDAITVTFDRDTDLAQLGLYQDLDKATVDSLFLFSHTLGADYKGQWLDLRTFRITILDPSGSQQPMLNRLFARCRDAESLPIKEADGSEGSCYDFTPLLEGDFGPASFSITASAEAWVNKTKLGLDSVFMAGDTIRVALDEDTNMGNFELGARLNTALVDRLLLFSRSIGSEYFGQWLSRREFEITMQDVDGAQQPLPDFLTVAFREEADVRNWPPQSAPVTPATSAVLRGDFGPAVIEVVSVVGNDPTDRDSIYDDKDTITINFNRDTNRGHDLPLTDITRLQIDNLLLFSHPLGADYTGRWDSASALTITIVDASGSAPPSIGSLWVGIKKSGNLRNAPAACAPADASFPNVLLEGDFGPSNIFIVDFLAEDPDNLDNEFSPGDTVLVRFSQETSRGGLPEGKDITKEQLDQIFSFEQPLGAAYTGQWRDNSSAIMIYISDNTGGYPVLDSTTVTVLASGNLRNSPPACKPSTATSPPLRGDFGRTIPYITQIVAQDPFGRDQIYGFLDTISIYFRSYAHSSRALHMCLSISTVSVQSVPQRFV